MDSTGPEGLDFSRNEDFSRLKAYVSLGFKFYFRTETWVVGLSKHSCQFMGSNFPSECRPDNP